MISDDSDDSRNSTQPPGRRRSRLSTTAAATAATAAAAAASSSISAKNRTLPAAMGTEKKRKPRLALVRVGRASGRGKGSEWAFQR